jgi:RecJ-like exonuclease
MDERQLKIISLAGSVASLIVLYIFVLYVVPDNVNICDVGLEHAGRTINVTGTVKDFRMNEGHAFFTLAQDGCEIRVVLWKDRVSGLGLRGTDVSLLRDNMTVSLTGEVDVHSGYLQIVPTRPDLKAIE